MSTRRFAFSLCIAIVLVGGFSTPSVAQIKATTRKSLFVTEQPDAGETKDERSLFTLGTFVGLGHSFDDPSSFKLQNNIVVYDEEKSKTHPVTYALPSFALADTKKGTLSLIIPVSLTTEVDAGFGGSYGFNTFKNADGSKKAEVGFSVVVVWSDVVRLTPQQSTSFTNGTALPSGAVTDFRRAMRPTIAFGFYIVPLL